MKFCGFADMDRVVSPTPNELGEGEGGGGPFMGKGLAWGRKRSFVCVWGICGSGLGGHSAVFENNMTVADKP